MNLRKEEYIGAPGYEEEAHEVIPRRIEFRGVPKDRVPGDDSEYVYGLLISGHVTRDGISTYEYFIGEDLGNLHEVFASTVGQYTGVQDENGTKIYEGDIIQGEYLFEGPIKGKIVFRRGSFEIELGDGGFTKPLKGALYSNFKIV